MFIKRCLYRSYSTAQRVHDWERLTKQHVSITHDHIVASPHNLLTNTLNPQVVNASSLAPDGTPLPPCYHHVYFPPRTPEPELAHDGYETDFFPPSPFSQRMWAGAEFSWSQSNPLSIGDQAKMTTQLDTVQLREGRMGESVMVWINKDIENQHGWCMRERRCLVYHPTQQGLSTSPPTVRGIPVKKEPDFSLTMTPSSILLFRYSALTFNSHKIHYDHLYATQIENHPACLVHGPLSGTLLTHLLSDKIKLGQWKQFSYKCLMPLYVNQPLTVAATQSNKGYDVWITNDRGHLAVKGNIDLFLE